MKRLDKLMTHSIRVAQEQHNRILAIVTPFFAVEALEHVQFCRLEDGRLRITVDNATWIAKLRFSETLLVEALRAEHFDVRTVSWHVSVQAPGARSTKRKAERHVRAGSASVDSLLARYQQVLPDDDELIKQLQRLSKHLQSEDQ